MPEIEIPADSRLARCVLALHAHLASVDDDADDQMLARMTVSAIFAQVERERPNSNPLETAKEVASRLGIHAQPVLAVELAAAQSLAITPEILRPAVGPALRALSDVLAEVS